MASSWPKYHQSLYLSPPPITVLRAGFSGKQTVRQKFAREKFTEDAFRLNSCGEGRKQDGAPEKMNYDVHATKAPVHSTGSSGAGVTWAALPPIVDPH